MLSACVFARALGIVILSDADLDFAFRGLCASQLMARSLTFLELAQMACFYARAVTLQLFNRSPFPARSAPDVLEMWFLTHGPRSSTRATR